MGQVLTMPQRDRNKHSWIPDAPERLCCSRCDTDLFTLLASGGIRCANCHRTMDNVRIDEKKGRSLS